MKQFSSNSCAETAVSFAFKDWEKMDNAKDFYTLMDQEMTDNATKFYNQMDQEMI